MNRIFFISDIHLNAHSPEVEAGKVSRLIAFLDHVLENSTCLYIVGDLYDFWFEYRHVIPRVNLKVLSKLNQLVEAGIAVHYLTGNHDLWQKSYLVDEIGILLYHDPIQVTQNGLHLFIAHGDDLAESDRKLFWLRRLFENRLNIMLYRWLHPDIGIPLAHWVTRKSAEKGENQHDADYYKFAVTKFDQGADAVILGHTHKPICRLVEDKYYINLGDWIDKFTYLEMTGKEFHLQTWQ